MLIISIVIYISHLYQSYQSVSSFILVLLFQVYAKGRLIFTSQLASDVVTGSQSFIISFLVTSSMAPNSRLLAYYFRPDGEMVTDSISFKVDAASDNTVSINVPTPIMQPLTP